MRNSRSVMGAALIGVGIGLLLAVAGALFLSRFQAWTDVQTRRLDSAALSGPAALPLTLMPPPLATQPARPTPTRVRPPTRSAESPAAAAPLAAAPPAAAPPQAAPVVPAPVAPAPPAAAPALLSIPKLKIERAIVPIDRVTRDDETDWDTDKLFATNNRSDLVGYLRGTGALGQTGNVVLAGHNYNRGRLNWRGVFANLKRLRKGDVISVVNAANERFTYQVVSTEQIHWPPRSDDDLRKHIRHHSTTPDETLTLVTCGGASLAPFPARFYVTAKRIGAPPAAAPPAAAPPAAAPPQAALATSTATATRPRPTAAATAVATPRPRGTVVAAPTVTPGAGCRATVTVRRGETLAMIARQYRVSVRSIAARNGITNVDRIYPGWRLCIP